MTTTWRPLGAACAVLYLFAPLAQAQDADVQARTQREAANPMRMIIEAGKLKPRTRTADADAPAAVAPEKAAPEKPVARAPAAKPAAADTAVRPVAAAEPRERPSAVLVASSEGASPRRAVIVALADDTPPQRPAAAPVNGADAPTAEAAGTAQSVPAASPADVPPAVLPSAEGLPTAPPPVPVDSPAASGRGAEPAFSAAFAPRSPPTAAPAADTLQLADYVAPQVPERIRRKMRADAEVVLGFTVNPDGSVADVAVRTSSEPALDPFALDAVRQWRYKPVATAQAHGALLVFRLRE